MRSRVIHLAHTNPELRPHLLPLLRVATRPIFVDKRALKAEVQNNLVPQVVAWLKRQSNQDSPIGSARGLASGHINVESAAGTVVRAVKIQVESRPTGAKGVAVISGKYSSASRTITVFVNGALSPADFLVPPPLWGNRLQPIWDCTHETCLAFGLYTVLLHEATHASEEVEPSLSYDPGKVTVSGEGDWDKYVNDPTEVRAFMQEVLDVAERWAPRIRDMKVTDNPRMVKIILTMSTTWKVIEKHLNPRSKAKILKAVYEVLDRKGFLF